MSDISTDDTFMESPNPVVKCPKCGAKQRWFEVKLHLQKLDKDGFHFGCLWCDCSFHEFTTPGPVIEHMIEGRQFRMEPRLYEPYYRERFIETMQEKGGRGHGHEKVARVLDELDMSAVDQWGGLRDIHRTFLEALVRFTEDPERKGKYEAEIERRETSKKRKKKPKMDDDASKKKWNPKKPKAGERIHEIQRGYHKDYYNK